MSLVIIISIRPELVINILKGKKTLELRKSVPTDFENIIKKHGGIWVNIYVTKAKPFITKQSNSQFTVRESQDFTNLINGKVVARFWFDEYDVVTVSHLIGCYPFFVVNGKDGWFNNYSTILKKAKITLDELEKYLGGNLNTKIFAWRIKKLEIFDKPKKLSDFIAEFDDYFDTDEVGSYVGRYSQLIPVLKAPQSWRYAYTKGEK